MSLALAIPVKDDHEALGRLLGQARAMGIFDQVVIVDDGSDPPLCLDGGRAGPLRPPVQMLRNDAPQGPGAARNRALDHVSAEYLVYMDSDDSFAPEFPALWREASQARFDLCLYRHHDTRQEPLGRHGQMPQDDGLWRRAGLGGAAWAAPVPLTEPARAHLAETANYPWNKIYRTALLRERGIGCAETLVHEDIRLHWLALLHADKAIASPRIGALHRVAEGADRLTNRSGAERLEVFGVLDEVWGALAEARARRDLLPAFLRFASGLFDWIRGRIAPDLAPRWREALRAFLMARLTPELAAELARRDPVLALRLTLQMAEGGLSS
ncbi:glycosyltransferase family 2 protein [Salipiger aestuarii]|uniref:glycosyltransferase family 2 protein n=1 Tax=Salipiger aestuarii TaxID=568098 RepID=UPI001239EA44|nr:glycosyltransferase family 2 protein [Salipiger aestuarii]KAA8610015.1 hypothetical protein AL037_14255 [Salipiger aestuarii]